MAAQAIGPVLEPHPEGAEPARPPTMGKEAQRRGRVFHLSAYGETALAVASAMAPASPDAPVKSGSQQTLRWRKRDSNSRSPLLRRRSSRCKREVKGRFPRRSGSVLRELDSFSGRDGRFESPFLHRRVCEPSVPRGWYASATRGNRAFGAVRVCVIVRELACLRQPQPFEQQDAPACARDVP
jgi:hypothetical protein